MRPRRPSAGFHRGVLLVAGMIEKLLLVGNELAGFLQRLVQIATEDVVSMPSMMGHMLGAAVTSSRSRLK